MPHVDGSKTSNALIAPIESLPGRDIVGVVNDRCNRVIYPPSAVILSTLPLPVSLHPIKSQNE
jgi:hypothetical protein